MINVIVSSESLEKIFFSNTLADYIDAFLYFAIALVILFLLQHFFVTRFDKFAKKTKTEVDDVLVEFVQSIRPRLYVILSIYIALHSLYLSDITQKILNIILIVVIIFQITRSAQIVIEFFAKKVSGADDDEHVKSAAHLLSAIMIIVVWVFGIMMILSNIGVNITSLVAGVGITGIAIAFAVKEVLADLFSSFSIYFDKPFKAGDIVKVDDEVGTVKKIGIKTTRIESRTGEELVVSNQDMTSSRVHNYKRMDYRTVRPQFIVAFDTPSDILRDIPDAVRSIIDSVDHAECKRVHLKEFGEWGFVFEMTYKINSRDYALYMDVQQEINFGVKDLLDHRGVEIATPAQVEMAARKK